MKRHEMWRLNYRKRRDLDHLTPDELSERAHDCINNLRTRTERGKLGLLSLKTAGGEAWIVRWTEIMEECKLRGYSYPGPISLAQHRQSLDHAFDSIPDMSRVLAGVDSAKQPCLFKFGEPKWLRQSFERGRFRIASAYYYDSVQLNHARRDTELTRQFRLNPRDPASRCFEIRSPNDYLLFCLATQYSARLFGDFASSACLVIRRPAVFLMRIASALQAKLPQWRIQTDLISYFDPVRVDPAKVAVPWFKPFRHFYQQELRIVGLPPSSASKLEPIEIEIGSLADCATCVDKDTNPPAALPPDPIDEPIRVFGSGRPDLFMKNTLPDASNVQGILLNKSSDKREDWSFEMQYTDAAGTWYQLRMPVSQGLYLMSLLQAADKEQVLSPFDRKNKSW
jgi:hypothetical protein